MIDPTPFWDFDDPAARNWDASVLNNLAMVYADAGGQRAARRTTAPCGADAGAERDPVHRRHVDGVADFGQGLADLGGGHDISSAS